MKQRLEFVADGSSKFWEIAVTGDSHTVRYGKLGTQGQTKTKSFESPALAARDAESLVRSKLKSGYVDPSQAAPTVAPAAAAPAEAPARSTAPAGSTAAAPSTARTAAALTLETVPVVMQSAPGAVDDHIVVRIGDGLAMLQHDGTRVFAEAIVSKLAIHSRPIIASSRSVFYRDHGGAVHAWLRGAAGWTSSIIFESPPRKTSWNERSIAATADRTGTLWLVVAASDRELALLSNRSGSFAVEHRWESSAIPAFFGTDVFVDIAADATGVQVAYADGDTLKLAQFDGTTFTEQVVRARSGPWVSIAVGADSTVHLAYMSLAKAKKNAVEYAVRGPSGWTFEIVDTKGHVGFETRIALDGDQPVIYFGERSCRYAGEQLSLGGGSTRLATRAGASWTIEDCGEGGWGLALARIAGQLVAVAGPTRINEADYLALAHHGAPLHPAGLPVEGAPEPKRLLLGGLGRALAAGKRIYLEKHDAFWEITLDGTGYTVRSGAVGTDGKTRQTTLATPAAAREAALGLFRKKYDKEHFKEPVAKDAKDDE